ncbi:MAG: SDR family NAD(P)-dependent oxidoreductase [Microcystaceae cyanobacterium]
MTESQSPNIDYRSLLKNAVLEIRTLRQELDVVESQTNEEIAIIGLGCRFPAGANTPEAFWQLLKEGVDGIQEVPSDRWDIDTYYDPNPDADGKMYTRNGGFLIEDISLFDPQFFGISPREANNLDPQQRLLLEVSWEALENAGISPSSLKGSLTGVFVGICFDDYSRLTIDASHPDQINAYSGLGTAKSIAAGRIAYSLDLQGPTMQVDTACSSSLLSVHLACQSLRSKESNLALAGGVNLILNPEGMISFCRLKALSPDGRCKTFDASADGYGRGEGCGMVVLKRLSDAIADQDNILAVIKGSAVNHDGYSNGLTAPNGQAQEKLVRQALKNSQIEPAQIQYIEAHGTGTSLGDPIEVKALGDVLKDNKTTYLGSVKANLGHLEGAAGIASLIKTVLCLQHQTIPPNPHFNTPNPHINWDKLPFSLTDKSITWPEQEKQRLAGISSFGMSGTNVHLIVAEAPKIELKSVTVERNQHLLCLSAHNEVGLQELGQKYKQWLTLHPEVPLTHICYTANVGRVHFEERLALISESTEQLKQELEQYLQGNVSPNIIQGKTNLKTPKTALLFTGQGSQYANMGKELYQTQPTFKQAINQCADILERYLDKPLLEILYPDNPEDSLINQTAYTQPCIFALEYALYQLWTSWGIQPDIVMGHSIGEYVAACVAGVFSLEDGLKLVAYRGKLIQSLPQNGEMVSLLTDENTARQAIEAYKKDVSLAAINGQQSIVISGRKEAIEQVVSRLTEQGIKTKKLIVSHAFHSPLMQPILEDFREIAQSVTYNKPQMLLISNVTGKIAGEEVTTSEYWVEHIRRPVNFLGGMTTVLQKEADIFLEIGAKPILVGMGKMIQESKEEENPQKSLWLPSLRPEQSNWQHILSTLSQMYIRGIKIDWRGFDRDYVRQKVQLPTYPFQRQSYWVETETRRGARKPAPTQLSVNSENIDTIKNELLKSRELSEQEIQLLPKLLNLLAKQQQKQNEEEAFKDWLYEIQWKLQPRTINLSSKTVELGTWVIFADIKGLGEKIANRLQESGHQCHLIFPDETYQAENHQYKINPSDREQFIRLWQDIINSSALPLQGVLHLWGLDTVETEKLNLNSLKQAQKLTCGSVLYALQTLAEHQMESEFKLWLITRNVQPIENNQTVLSVAQSPLWGMGKVVGLEFPQWWGGMIDLGNHSTDKEVEQLLSEIGDSQQEEQIAYRGNQRYVARLVRSKPNLTKSLTLHSDKTYLITGGLGSLGLKVAQWMVEKGIKNLVLTSRREASEEKQVILNQLREKGVTIEVMQADVADENGMRALFEQINGTLPPLKGIIHAAGTLDDGILLEQDWQRFKEVMSAKVLGTWNLHQLTQNHELNFCIFFSSVASLLGSPGQGNYAAANQFMDSLAHYRHQQGQAGLSINWGPWDGEGMVANLESQQKAKLKQQGVNFISLQKGVKILEKLLNINLSEIGILPIDWSIFTQFGKPDSLLSELISVTSIAENEKPSPVITENWLNQLHQASFEEQVIQIQDYLKQIVAKALRMTIEQVKIEKPLNTLGIDSLMAMELRNQVKTELNIDIPVTHFIAGQNVLEISHFIMEKLESSLIENHIDKPPKLDLEIATEEDILDNLEQLSDSDIDHLLSKMLTESEG